MNRPQLHVIYVEDWAALYVDGKLVFDYHVVEPEHIQPYIPELKVSYGYGTELDDFNKTVRAMPETLEQAIELIRG